MNHRGPPGTVYLGNGDSDPAGFDRDVDGHVILHPRPSNDPNEPLNWSTRHKTINFATACLFTLMVFATLDVGTVTWNALEDELGFDSGFLNNSYAAGLAGMTVGCIFFIPAALIFGRKPVFFIASLTMVLVNVGQALFRTKTQYIVLQVIAGLAGSINDTIIQMTISDLFFVHQRATMNGIYSVMVVIGTYLSLIPAGYIVISQGWRWVWWWCAIINAAVLMMITFAYEETRYDKAESNCFIGEEPPSDIQEKSDLPLSPKKSNPEPHPYIPETAHTEQTMTRKTYIQRMSLTKASSFSINTYMQHVWRPFVLLFRIPAVAFVAIEYSFIMCWVAILATTQPVLFAQPPYLFSAIGVGNINVAPFIGALVGSIYGGPVNDYYVVFVARRRSGIYDPETRLHMLAMSMILTPLGLWLYGISISRDQPWIIPLIGSALVGFGIGSTTSITLTYFADSYREIVAEGLIVITYVRNGLATATTFAINPWLNGLGVQNMFISVGCLCIGIQLLFIPMVVWGRRARGWTEGYYTGLID
ncbi:hypothetical protein ASPWEDRAFT_54605 [Aspergillus wentii DTO 134E9]|uniref:Major facilitator superfamily (MFS) profile domain-containing protein n=1 Tax=Aspergillus wentii DTO 134E9 TaxID=1073089 RepID=A0A1L9R9C7_ASPWE|nr:uncharacterized protein ASPWEDRAFT_54605 [Aspergillus wentii DTO 134E9]OJJ31457.1 hypothetical protein ASPWEDRAFT_54605 [Aspergillus wentii DTO 134E9]